MIACSGMTLPEGNHNGLKAKVKGHYGCPKVNTKAKPLAATIIFLSGSLGLTLTPGCNQTLMELTRPLWVGRYALRCHTA